jgi:TPP-dependent pyruvate/acetoin dehydrogenase alpha subunit
MQISAEQKLKFYRQMCRVREFEDTARKNFFNGNFQGFLHLGIGEEASMAGIVEALNEGDYISSTHRGHGVTLLKGADSKRMMAELAGRETGLSHGRGGSMHMGDVTKGVLGSNGILGASGPIVTGVALAQKLMGKNNVSVCYYGDGTSNEGAIHEAMNFAAVKKLPVIFACINNQYGMWTSVYDASANSNIADRAVAYNMPGIAVDGNNVFEAYETVMKAVNRARAGEGPSLIEFKTYRWYDHSLGIRDDFRPKEEVEEWKAKCPIKRLKNLLIDEGINEAKLDQIEKDAKDEMIEALEYALNSPYPIISEIGRDVYTNMEVEVNRA